MKIVNYTASNFEGHCEVEETFVPYLVKMNNIALQHKMIVVVTSSLRKDANVKGAIVTPAQMSNHMVGHAIDCNLRSLATGEYFNSKKMGDRTGLDEKFIKEVEATTGLRWGGEFNTKDEVHFDDGLNIHNPEKWHQIYNELHK